MSTAAYDTVEKCHQRKDTKKVLKYVNKMRSELGLQPLKYLTAGFLADVSKCSIANSLTSKYTTASVTGDRISVTRFSRLRGNKLGKPIQSISVAPPAYVTDWITAFDSGYMPGLRK